MIEMTKLPKKPPFDFTSIGSIKTVEDVKRWLLQYARDFDIWYVKLMDTVIGNVMAESRRYRFKEDGDDLIVQWRNDSEIWVDTGWKLKKPT